MENICRNLRTFQLVLFIFISHSVGIQEQNKLSPEVIGRTLILNGRQYNDINEILATFIGPMNTFVADAIEHRMFRKDMPLEEIGSKLIVTRLTRKIILLEVKKPQTLIGFLTM